MTGQLQKRQALGALICGIIEIVVALIVVICSFVLADKANMSTVLTPYWAGIPFFVPGILGVVSGATKNKCAMIAFMILNIICFIINGLGTILVGIVLALWLSYAKDTVKNCRSVGYQTCVCSVDGDSKTITGISDCNVIETIGHLLTAITVFLIIGAVITLAASILGCISTCCTNDQPTTVIVQQPGGMAIQQNQQQPPNYYPTKQ